MRNNSLSRISDQYFVRSLHNYDLAPTRITKCGFERKKRVVTGMTKDALLRHVCSELQIKLEDVWGNSRYASITTRRNAVMWTLREVYGWSYADIGKLLKRDHSTIINGVRKHRKAAGIDNG